MKTINQSLMAICAIFLVFNFSMNAQDQQRPEYIVATTMHWNMNNDDFKMDEWKAVEKELLDKVTSKNEYIMSSGFYLHNMTPDNTELIYVTTYPNWDAIDKAAKRSTELMKEAWPDESARKAFAKNRRNYYSPMHSDEIYATMPNAKPLPEAAGDKDMILYLRFSHFAFPENGTNEEFDQLNKEFVDNVYKKNDLIKGYYPNAHAYGSDRTQFVEAFYLDSMADLDKMFDKNTELYNANWKDEKARNDRGDKIGKYFTGVHGDYIYTYVSGLSK